MLAIVAVVACRERDVPSEGPDDTGPSAVDVAIEPVEPVQGRDALSCMGGEGSVVWTVDGVEVSGSGVESRTIDAATTRVGRVWSCAVDGGSAEVEVAPLAGNILLFLLDDVGVDKVGVYDQLDDHPPQTPVIDGLAEEGIRFTRAWSTPVCSPTRATLLTGRFGRRTGLGRIIDEANPTQILGYDEVFIPEMLAHAPSPWSTAMAGKWHLAWIELQYFDHPSVGAGFDYHVGPMDNLRRTALPLPVPDGEEKGYFHWENNNNNSVSYNTRYVTDYTAEQAGGLAGAMPEPWFLYVPLSAAHIPYHEPPDDFVYTPAADDTDPERFRVMVESADIAIGRVLDGLDPALRARTTVMVIGDNGTARNSMSTPVLPAKGTVFEGGVNVPFIVAGNGVEVAGVTDVPVHTVDVFDTVAAMAGADLAALDAMPGALPRDSESFLPVFADLDSRSRVVNYTENFEPNGPGPHDTSVRAVSDGRFKLIVFEAPQTGQLFYDLDLDPRETENLLAGIEPEALAEPARTAYTTLRAQLEELRDALVYDAPIP